MPINSHCRVGGSLHGKKAGRAPDSVFKTVVWLRETKDDLLITSMNSVMTTSGRHK